jgi:hypothetical protein
MANEAMKYYPKRQGFLALLYKNDRQNHHKVTVISWKKKKKKKKTEQQVKHGGRYL